MPSRALRAVLVACLVVAGLSACSSSTSCTAMTEQQIQALDVAKTWKGGGTFTIEQTAVAPVKQGTAAEPFTEVWYVKGKGDGATETYSFAVAQDGTKVGTDTKTRQAFTWGETIQAGGQVANAAGAAPRNAEKTCLG